MGIESRAIDPRIVGVRRDQVVRQEPMTVAEVQTSITEEPNKPRRISPDIMLMAGWGKKIEPQK